MFFQDASGALETRIEMGFDASADLCVSPQPGHEGFISTAREVGEAPAQSV